MAIGQETGDHEEDEPDGSMAECSDNDSEAESSSDMHGDDHEGSFSSYLSISLSLTLIYRISLKYHHGEIDVATV